MGRPSFRDAGDASQEPVRTVHPAGRSPRLSDPYSAGASVTSHVAQNYGTVLIDCESGAPLELLEERDARPLADWLSTHPVSR